MNHKSEFEEKKPPAEPEFILGVPEPDAPLEEPLAAVPEEKSPKRERRTVEQWESLGVPDQMPKGFESVTPAESRLLHSVETPVVADDVWEPDLKTDFWRGLVGSPAVIAILILLTCLILLAVGAQVLALVTQLAALTGVVRLIGYAATGLLGALSLWAIVRLATLYFRLKSNEPISLRRLGRTATKSPVAFRGTAASAGSSQTTDRPAGGVPDGGETFHGPVPEARCQHAADRRIDSEPAMAVS